MTKQDSDPQKNRILIQNIFKSDLLSAQAVALNLAGDIFTVGLTILNKNDKSIR